jgi:hypothetical protein
MTVTAILGLLTALINQAGVVSALLTKLQGEGRTTLNPDEWASLLTADDAATVALSDAIKAHLTAGGTLPPPPPSPPPVIESPTEPPPPA